MTNFFFLKSVFVKHPTVEALEVNFNRVNLRLMVAFLLVYVFNVILYFTWITPDLDLQPKNRWTVAFWILKYKLTLLRLKIFDNFEELNITGLVETGGETILLLSEKIGNISNGVFTNISHKTENVFKDTFLHLE